jgi:SAM-dependent methyltransferase
MTVGRRYFEDLYEHDGDPWGFRTRWYEARKRQMTLAALPQRYYETVFEPGCAIGLLTRELASRSGRVLAMDISSVALRQARSVLPENVELVRGSVPADWPAGHFDLIVLSELGYYLDVDDCRCLAELAVSAASDVIAVHWRYAVHDYPITGDRVHGIIERAALDHGLAQLCSHVEPDYLLDVWSRDHRSVGRRTGLVHP